MKKERLLELAGVQVNEDEAVESLMIKAAKAVAEVMMAHYENPVDVPYEFLADYPKEVQEWVDENVTQMYGAKTKPFRQAVYLALKKKLKI